MKEHIINPNFLKKYAELTKMEKYHINMSLKYQIIIKKNIFIGFRETREYGMIFQKYMMTNVNHFIEKD